jgi:hypothetical protein
VAGASDEQSQARFGSEQTGLPKDFFKRVGILCRKVGRDGTFPNLLTEGYGTHCLFPRLPRRRLFLFPQRRSERHGDEKALRGEEPAYGLAPGLGLVPDEHLISARFQVGGGLLQVVYLEFQPGLRDGKVVGPGVGAKAGLRRLRKRPQGKVLRALEGARIEISASVLFERDAEAVGIESATVRDVAIDGTEARNEQDFRGCVRHGGWVLLCLSMDYYWTHVAGFQTGGGGHFQVPDSSPFAKNAKGGPPATVGILQMRLIFPLGA